MLSGCACALAVGPATLELIRDVAQKGSSRGVSIITNMDRKLDIAAVIRKYSSHSFRSDSRTSIMELILGKTASSNRWHAGSIRSEVQNG